MPSSLYGSRRPVTPTGWRLRHDKQPLLLHPQADNSALLRASVAPTADRWLRRHHVLCAGAAPPVDRAACWPTGPPRLHLVRI